MIKYGDGNGNQYIIEQGSIEYNPVKPYKKDEEEIKTVIKEDNSSEKAKSKKK